MRIGVTGGTGFIGQYLLRDYGHDYTFVVPVRNKSKKVSARVSAQFVESDYSVNSLAHIFSGCDAVIHLAAKGMPKNRNPLKLEEYMPNVTVSASVFEACKEIGIPNIIHMSTKAVWGEHLSMDMLSEKDVPDPENEYGVSKLCSDMLAEFYNENYGMKIKIYRMGEICGFDLSKGMQNPFWTSVLNACENGEPVPIYGKGIGRRELIYVKDVTRAIVIGLDKNVSGIYNISSGHITTNMEIAEVFCDIFNNKKGIKLYPEKEEWGTQKCLVVDKAKNELGFEASYDLTKIVKDIQKEYILSKAIA